eukprot:TRINITY_DN2068_c0_g1_i2.p1 TRINITY_DN2068_c0_g1~~TRINITY_DN2068_c0_g1_i2.p1  ORF type:complete len:170 (+),score=38.49 TRINITY_DN2068_c0_g1_i2:61-570(+)
MGFPSSTAFNQPVHVSGEDTVSSATIPVQASTLRRGSHCMMKGRPCKVVDMSVSSTGKHGHDKIHFIGVDVFTTKKIIICSMSTHMIDVPVLHRHECVLLYIDDEGYCTMMTKDDTEKSDTKLPSNELGARILEDFEDGKELRLTLLRFIDEEKVVSVKECHSSSTHAS